MISSEQVKFMRLQHGWSQQHLASITDISVRTIQRIEKDGDCSLESKMALASAFGVAPCRLYPVVLIVCLKYSICSVGCCLVSSRF